MKHKKTIIFSVVAVLLMGAVATAYLILNSRCVVDGSRACYNKELESFNLEDKATLSVQVDSKEIGDFLVSKWNVLHPGHKDAITYVVKDALTLGALAQEFETDIIYTTQNNAAYVINRLFDMGHDVDKHVLYYTPSQLEDAININGTYFIPNSVKGWQFVYNETLAKELGFDLSDENNDGLPDVFESWERIFALQDTILENLDYVFPLTFIDQESFYPFLTGGRWRLNFTHKGDDAGFSHREFLSGLELIEDFSHAILNKQLETQNSETLKWEYETAFYDRQTLFTMVSDWMMLDQYQELTGDTYVYAPFPKYKGNYLSPMAEVEGYMVSKHVKYPSAAAEVLRILRSGEAASHYQNKDHKVFVYHRNHLSDLDVDASVLNQIRAYSHSDTEPVMALDANPEILARDLYRDVDIMQPLRDLFDQVITKEVAQEQIIELAKEWYEAHQIEETP